MKDYVGSHHVLSLAELAELALGTPLELWLGTEGETDEERAAREAAALDILNDDPGLYVRALRTAAEVIETHHRPRLLRFTPPGVTRRGVRRSEVAA